jgi:hypothetical protein
MTFEEYLSIQAISRSDLSNLLRSVAHYLYYRETARKDTPAMRIGRIVHHMCLTPSLPINEPGATQKEIEQAHAIAQSVLASADVQIIIGHPACKAEQTITWEDDGHRCKARLDAWVLPARVIADIKTTADASPEAFSRAIYKSDYDLQAAFYCLGATVAGHADHRDFIFIVAEKEPPYMTACYRADDSVLRSGMAKIEKAFNRLADVKRRGVVVAKAQYHQGIIDIGVPRWAGV